MMNNEKLVSAEMDDRYHKLIDLAQLLNQQDNYTEILDLVASNVIKIVNTDYAFILMVDPKTNQTVKTLYKQGKGEAHPQFHSLRNQLSGWIFLNKKSFISENFKNDKGFKNVVLKDIPIKSVIGVPIFFEGAIIGTMVLVRRDGVPSFVDEDLSFLEKTVLIAAPYLHNIQRLQKYFNPPLSETNLLKEFKKYGLYGKSKKFVELLRTIDAVAKTDVRVLLEGESGTGKELIARAIHCMSERHDKPFIAVDCAAIPENLLESEFFGHVKGAFTSALQEREGLFKAANHGTLFMDEISNLPIEMQAKLLRVLQENCIRPVGGNKTISVDVRIISASSQSLSSLVDEKKFRSELFYRLYVYPIFIPSLSERRDDIPILANIFLKKFANIQNKKIEGFHISLINFMQERKWVGNIRELENFVERLVTLTADNTEIIQVSTLPAEFKKELHNMKSEINDLKSVHSLAESLDEYEKSILFNVLTRCNWNKSKAARILKISEHTVRYKIDKFGIQKGSNGA